MNKYNKIIEICSQLLYKHPIGNEALHYLNNRLLPEIQHKFLFGFFPSQEYLSILCSFMDDKELLDTGLIYNDKENSSILFSSLQRHNLILPYRDTNGKIIAIVGRSLLDDDKRKETGIPKYKNTSFKKSRHLFGLYEGKKSILEKGYVYVVEGQFDCIKAHDNNIENIVALGSSNMSMEQLILLLRYTNKIRLLLDNDEAGESGRAAILEKYSKYTNISNAYIPNGFKDLDDFLNKMKIESSNEIERILM